LSSRPSSSASSLPFPFLNRRESFCCAFLGRRSYCWFSLTLSALYLSHLLRFFFGHDPPVLVVSCNSFFLLPLTSLASAVLSLMLPFTLHTFTAFSRAFATGTRTRTSPCVLTRVFCSSWCSSCSRVCLTLEFDNLTILLRAQNAAVIIITRDSESSMDYRDGRARRTLKFGDRMHRASTQSASDSLLWQVSQKS